MNTYLKDVPNVWNIGIINFDKNYSTMGERRVDLLETDRGNFILKSFPKEVNESQIIKYTNSIEYLSSKEPIFAPVIFKTIDGNLYARINGQFTYLMEKIEGRLLQENIEDEFRLGQTSARLHLLTDYDIPTCLNVNERIQKMKNRFSDLEFKSEYDEIVNSLPNFDNYKQAFIHTDIGPHNAMIDKNQRVIFIDLDDAGQGSPFIDIGYPLITQFVQFNKETKECDFNIEVAKAFYSGYNSVIPIKREEKELIFQGAVFMQLMYMPCFGEDAVEDMWKILKFGVDNKEILVSVIPEN